MGYSPEFVDNMQEIVEKIRDDQMDFPIKVVAEFDHACSACPHRGETICEAGEGSNEHVLSMDHKAIRKLGLKAGAVYNKSDLLQITAKNIHPDDLDFICKGCSWLSYGVCKEGISAIRARN
jgi:hypothetical protein